MIKQRKIIHRIGKERRFFQIRCRAAALLYKTLGVDNLLRCKVFTDPAACELSVGLFLRLGADQIADAEKLGTFSAGDSVTVISSENGWSKIDYNGTEAYVASDYLSDTQPTAAPAATQAPSSSDQQETMVWVSDSGKKYHSKSSCSNMSNPHQISLSDAQAQGYTPCKKCH